MSFDFGATRDGYRSEYPIYKELTDKARTLLESAVEQHRLRVEVDGRPKDVASFLRKAIRKHAEQPAEYADPLAKISDKAGVRAVVEHRDDAALVRGIVEEVFDTFEFEDTSTRLRPHELGYLGWHLQARLHDHSLSADEQHLRDRQFEIQIHTIAQHAWSAVSHPIVYKPLGSEPPPTVTSRVFRAVALVSLFDEEIAAVRQILRDSPDYFPSQMLAELDRQFVDWVQGPTDDQLSLQILGVVQRSHRPHELARFPELIDEFVRSRRSDLDVVFHQYASASEDYPLLFQPESLAICERLVSAKAQLRQAWIDSPLPVGFLEEIASAFGEPY